MIFARIWKQRFVAPPLSRSIDALPKNFFAQKSVTTATLLDIQAVKRCRFVADVTELGRLGTFSEHFLLLFCSAGPSDGKG